MTLLKLSPGAERLRRIAKAFAAGELPAAEYRRIRGDVIDGFMQSEPRDVDWDDDNTERRLRSPGQRVPASTPSTQTPGVPAAGGARAHRRALVLGRRGLWPWWWVAGATLLATLIALTVAVRPVHAATVTIPPVAERDPNPFTSQRFDVRAISVRELPEFPDLGIDHETVQAFLNERLAELERAAAPLEHGFTDDELAELGQLLNALGVHAPGARLSSADAAEVLALIQAQKSRRGLSLIALESLAADLSRFYRARGVPLAVAYVPVQDVVDGHVELAVLPGVLAGTRVSGARAPATLIERALAPQFGAPVEAAAIESVLFRLNDLPGVRADGRFVAGDDVGTTVLNLNVDYDRAWDARLRVDNHGSGATGEVRTLLEGRWFNPRGRSDVLRGGVLATWDPANARYGYLEYRSPMRDIATDVGVRASIDAFDWSDGMQALSGESRTFAVLGSRQLLRGRTRSTALDVGIERQLLSLDDDITGIALQDQSLLVFTAAVRDERVLADVSLGGLQPADIALQAHTQFDAVWLDSGFGVPADTVARATFDAAAWRVTHLSWFGVEQRLRLGVSGQVATDALPGTLQRALGGPRGSAAFAYPTLSVDEGLFAHADLRFRPQRLPDAGELLLFVDAATGTQKRELARDLSATLISAGLGWEHQVLGQVAVQLKLAWPLASDSSGFDIDQSGPRLLMLLEYRP
jgi:hemolysin activation/secretion protein